jgi:cyclopropane fatty-acyl-phospholipid synthase-like methyltransferase
MLLKFIAGQFKKPEGLAGRLVAKIMEKGNQKTYDWMISLLDIKKNDRIFEIGFGTGFVLNSLAGANNDITLYGIDFSKVMFKKAYKRNKKYIDQKKVFIKYGDLLDYNDSKNFNKIFGINVIYFWKDLESYFTKIYDLLKEKGALLLYMADKEELIKLKFTATDVFNKYTPEHITGILNKCGFKKTGFTIGKTNMEKAYCIIGEK